MLRRAAVVVPLALGGCTTYQPGSFASRTGPFQGERTTAGCLDIAVARRSEPLAANIIQYQFANRCDRPALVDLGAVAVVGRTIEGAEVSLEPYDPGAEIKPFSLDARLVGQEALAYESSEPLTQICVDMASIGRATPAQWQCFATNAETL